MQFTAEEMELICFFYAGTREKTLETLRGCAPDIQAPARREAALRVIEKLTALAPGDPVSLAFDTGK